MLSLFVAVIFTLNMVGCGIPTISIAPAATATPACDKVGYVAVVTPLLEQFDDGEAVADVTARINLAPQVATLQSIKRSTEVINVPVCMATAQNDLITAMQWGIQSYLDFMNQSSDTQVQIDITSEKYYKDLFHQDINFTATTNGG